MRICLTDSSIPEFAGLTQAECRTLKAIVIQKLAEEKPWVRWIPHFWSTCGAVAGFFTLQILAQMLGGGPEGTSQRILIALSFGFVGFILGGTAGGFLGNQFLISKIRRYLTREPSGTPPST